MREIEAGVDAPALETMFRRAGLPLAEVRATVERALAEDIGWGDLTSEALIPAEATSKGRLVAKGEGILAGLPVAALAFELAASAAVFEACATDGQSVGPGGVVGRVSGSTRGLLSAERVALNFLQRLSGIATATARYVKAVAGLPVRVVDTRKTTPGLRCLEKYAVRVGGGHNHRFNLSDGVLIKDNHIAALAAQGIGLAEGVRRARERIPHTIKIEVEVDRLEQIEEALAGGADAILLDNMTPEQMREAVRLIAGRAQTEASGKVTLENIRAKAEAGVDIISCGTLTHSAPALDISLDFE